MKRHAAELLTRDPERFFHHDRVFLNNPVVMQGMGLAPLVVLATSGQNALMLAVAVALLLTPSRMLACLLSRLFPLREEHPANAELEKKLLPRSILYSGSAAVVYLAAYPILNRLFGVSLLVLGMMLMRLSGSYNMAVGAQMTFSAALLGVLLQRFSVPVWAACAVVLVVAVALGILYTVLSSRLQIPLFYLSLCVHLLLDGLNGFFYRMTRQTSNYAYAGADRTRWLGVPLWCWIALAALALGTAYLNRTTYGRSLFLLPWYHDVRWQEIGESRRIKTGTRLKLDLILGAANVLSCVLVGLSGILLALRGGTTAFYSGMNYTCRILTAASIGGWMNATRRSLPVGALLGSMSLVLILMLEVHLRITSSYVEYCLSAVLILMSAALGAAQKKKRLQPKNRIT